MTETDWPLARIAEMTYASAQSLDVAQEYYRDVKARMAKYGRDIDESTDFDLESVDRDFHTLIRIEPIRAWTVS